MIVGAVADKLEIGRKQLYILPTKMGWYFALIMASLFGIAVKFDNQAAFMMLFLLISIALLGMLYTNNNVLGLRVSAQDSKAVFLGAQAEFPVTVQNPSKNRRHAVWLVCGGYHQVLELEPDQNAKVTIKLPTVQRGYLNCDPICLTSQFPLGIFFCWSKQFKTNKTSLVYPQPLNLVPLNMDNHAEGKQEDNQTLNQGTEDFRGMKQYQEGDRIRDIHWPSVAKTNKLVTREYDSKSPSTINISWKALPPGMSIEDKLSQLCFWVVESEKEGVKYQLEMPNNTVEYDSGSAHLHKCLKILAIWGLDTKGNPINPAKVRKAKSKLSKTPGLTPAQ